MADSTPLTQYLDQNTKAVSKAFLSTNYPGLTLGDVRRAFELKNGAAEGGESLVPIQDRTYSSAEFKGLAGMVGGLFLHKPLRLDHDACHRKYIYAEMPSIVSKYLAEQRKQESSLVGEYFRTTTGAPPSPSTLSTL